MFNLIRKDILVTYSNKLTVFMILLYFPLILLIMGKNDINSIFMFTAVSFVFITTKVPFSYEIRDKPQILIQSLPIKKIDIVLSKYIGIILNFGLATVYTLIYMGIANATGFINMNTIKISTILVTFGFTILALSLSMPMQFSFTPKVANFANMLLYVIIINIIIIEEEKIFKFLNLDFSNLDNILIIAGSILGVYLISIVISMILYKNRKFY